MKKQEKIDLVEALQEDLKQSAGIVAVDFTGLKMDEITEVRQRIKDSGGNFKVIKNSLIRIATERAGLKDLQEFLEGPTALGWHHKEVVVLAKILTELTKKYEHLKIKGGIIEGTKVNSVGVEALSRLPSRQELLAQLAGGLSSQPRQMLMLLRALPQKMLGLLNALKDKKNQ